MRDQKFLIAIIPVIIVAIVTAIIAARAQRGVTLTNFASPDFMPDINKDERHVIDVSDDLGFPHLENLWYSSGLHVRYEQ